MPSSERKMKAKDWDNIKYFSKDENWGEWRKMSYSHILELDHLRHYIGCPIYVNRGYDLMSRPGSTHRLGVATDCHVKGIPLMDFFLAASRFNFAGLGVYVDWNFPGLHLDHKPDTIIRRLWGRVNTKYVNLDAEFLNSHVFSKQKLVVS